MELLHSLLLLLMPVLNGVSGLWVVCCDVAVGSGGDPDAETGARLTCHMLLRLFQMMNTMPTCSSDAKRGSVFVRSSCDRHLLEAAHKRINVGAVVAVLKAILMLGMTGCMSYSGSCKVNRYLLVYLSLSSMYTFQPIALDNLRVYSHSTLSFISELGHQMLLLVPAFFCCHSAH